MDSQTGLLIATTLAIAAWYGYTHPTVRGYIWSNIFGLQFLVYQVGIRFDTLVSEVYAIRSQQEASTRALEESASLLERIHTSTSRDLGSLRTTTERLDHREGSARSYFQGEIVRLRDSIHDIKASQHNQWTLLLGIYRILFREGALGRAIRFEGQEGPAVFERQQEPAAAAPPPYPRQEERQDPPRPVPQRVEEINPFNDLSGNEELAPNSPPGPTLSLQGQQFPDQTTESQTSTEQGQISSPEQGGSPAFGGRVDPDQEDDSEEVRRAVGRATWQAIQRIIDSDTSSDSTEYPNTDSESDELDSDSD